MYGRRCWELLLLGLFGVGWLIVLLSTFMD